MKKPWRMRSKYRGVWGRPIAFSSEAAARSAARMEESVMGATETEVWRVVETKEE